MPESSGRVVLVGAGPGDPELITVLMGSTALPVIAERLMAAGRPASTPVAVVQHGTTTAQRVVKGTLGDIASRAADVVAPAVIVIGDVVGLASRIAPPLVPASSAFGPHHVGAAGLGRRRYGDIW